MPTRACPYCAEPIQAEAIRCRFCGESVSGPPSRPQGLVNDVPLGTILGVFTFVVLTRQSVKPLFDPVSK